MTEKEYPGKKWFFLRIKEGLELSGKKIMASIQWKEIMSSSGTVMQSSGTLGEREEKFRVNY